MKTVFYAFHKKFIKLLYNNLFKNLIEGLPLKSVIRLILVWLLLFSFGFGYKLGDAVEASIVKDLSLEEEQVYVVNFFASWCKSCKHELPLVNKISKKIKIIGVNIDRKRDAGEAFVKKLGLDFTIIYDNESKIVKAFDPIGVPAIYFIKNNQVIAQKIGAVDEVDNYILKTVEEIK
jgi:thiol-disulfide isomerase/thioredoxin